MTVWWLYDYNCIIWERFVYVLCFLSKKTWGRGQQHIKVAGKWDQFLRSKKHIKISHNLVTRYVAFGAWYLLNILGKPCPFVANTSQYFICQALAETTQNKAQGRSDPPTHGPAAQTSQQPQGEPCIYKAGANACCFSSRSFRKLHWLLKPLNGDLMNILKMPETQESKRRNQKDARSWNGKHWRTPFSKLLNF